MYVHRHVGICRMPILALGSMTYNNIDAFVELPTLYELQPSLLH